MTSLPLFSTGDRVTVKGEPGVIMSESEGRYLVRFPRLAWTIDVREDRIRPA